MEQISINTNEQGVNKVMQKSALQSLANNVNLENLIYLERLSKKKNINEKLKSKKGLIDTFI